MSTVIHDHKQIETTLTLASARINTKDGVFMGALIQIGPGDKRLHEIEIPQSGFSALVDLRDAISEALATFGHQ